MKKKMKSKLIAAVMTLAMAFTMMPMMESPVHATGHDNNELVISDETNTVPIVEGEIAWLNEESNDTGTWFGLDNSERIFPEGSVFWKRWVKKEHDSEAWANYYGMLDDKHKRKADPDRLWIFLCGATDPNGTEISDFKGKTADLYIQLGADWDKNDVKAVFIDKDGNEDVQVEPVNDFIGPEGIKEYAKLKLEHFSPYAIYQEKSDSPSDPPNVKPSDSKKSNVSPANDTPKVSGTLTARMKAGKKSLSISWNRIQGAAGYDIFFARCNHGKKKNAIRNIKMIKGNKTFKWTKSGLKKRTAYKACVKAYIYKNGKKTYVRNSPHVHAYTGNGTKYHTNAKSVSVNKTKVTLKKGKTFKIKAKDNKVNKKKKLMPKSHAPTLRYMTSNKKVATVSSNGKIKAVAKGKCCIYAYAHNGVSKKVTVIVK